MTPLGRATVAPAEPLRTNLNKAPYTSSCCAFLRGRACAMASCLIRCYLVCGFRLTCTRWGFADNSDSASFRLVASRSGATWRVHFETKPEGKHNLSWREECRKRDLPVKPFSRDPFSGPTVWDPLHRDFDLLQNKTSSFSAGGAWTTFSSFCCGYSASLHHPTVEIGCRRTTTCPCFPSSAPTRSSALERNFLQ